MKITKDMKIIPGFRQIGLAVGSGVLLALSYPNFNLNILAWICFVPLLFALETCKSGRQAYLTGLLTGVAGICIGFYWVGHWAIIAMKVPFPLNVLFVLGFSFCFGQVFGAITLLFYWIKHSSGFDEIVVFPIVFVAVFSFFPLLFNFRLGDSQWQFVTAIQSIDITGIAGLDLVVALSSVFIYKIFFKPCQTRSWGLLVVAGMILAAWFFTGWIKLHSWDQEITGWQHKRIGIVQPNRSPTLEKPVPLPGFSRVYPLEMKLSEELVAAGADLLVWPEGHFYGFDFWDNVKKSFKKTISQWQVPLIFYDPTRRKIGQKTRSFNTILFMNPEGELVDTYDKVKLVPFSEHLPVLENWPLFDWILGDYLDNLTPGAEAKTATTAGMRIVPKVCYEPLFPEFVADSIGADASGKIILVQSQDGWFGTSSQPFQHMAVTVIRAVENRVPLIHVIQNGPSGVIHPNGRFAFLSDPFVRGAWVAEMAYNPESGGSFYSRHPNLFVNTIRLLCLFLILVSLYRRKTK